MSMAPGSGLGFWLRVPRWLPQALAVRRTALRLPEADGAHHGIAEPNQATEPHSGAAPLALLGLGDSVAMGVGVSNTQQCLTAALAQALAQRHQRAVAWQICGRSGYDSHDLCRKVLPTLPQQQLDAVLVSVGVNDVTGLTPRWRWRAAIAGLLAGLHQRYPRARLLLCGVPPMACFPALPYPLRDALGQRAARLDQCYRAVASRYPTACHVATPGNLPSAAFAEDGFHPNEEGCRALAHYLVDALAQQRWALPEPGQGHDGSGRP